METTSSVAQLDPIQDMTIRALHSAPARSAARLAVDWIRGGDLPDWPQFAQGTAILTYQCRDAIALACRLLGLQEGDEVLVPAYNCGSEIDPIVQQKLHVRLFRVDAQARIDVQDVACRVTEKTRAILVTHYFGWAQDLEFIIDLCRARGLYLIEDCAHALFSASSSGWLGRHGDIAVYSLAKSLPVPHGGVAVLRDPEYSSRVQLRRSSSIQTARDCLALIRRNTVRAISNTRMGGAAILRWRGKREDGDATADLAADRPDMPADYYFNKDSLTTGASRIVPGALANVNPDRIVDIRRRNYQRLVEATQSVQSMRPLFASLAEGTCPLHLPVVVERRRSWISALTTRGVYALPWWEGYHRRIDWSGFAEAAMLKERILTLPIHHGLTDTDIDLIGDCVRQTESHAAG